MPTSAQFNRKQFNEGIPVVSQALPRAHEEVTYRIEVRTRTGSLVAYLPEWNAGEFRQSINEPSRLSFSYPALVSRAQYLTFPNQIWLYDHRNRLIDKFHILPTSRSQSGVKYTMDIECESLIYQLNKEFILEYEATKSVKKILQDWLKDYQLTSLPIRVGSIDNTIGNQEVSIHVQGKSILDALRDLFSLVNQGVYYVDSSRRLNWKNRLHNYQGQQIRVKKNLIGVTVTEDTSKLVNRVYVYGRDSGPLGRLNLTDAGLPNEYKQNSASVTAYGVHTAVKVLKNAREASTLEDYADAVLEKFAWPFYTYEIDVADLAAYDPENMSFEEIALGKIVKVINEDLDIETRQTIVSVTRELTNPSNVKVVLANKLPELTDFYEGILDRISELENAPAHDLAEEEIEEDLPTAIGDEEASVGESSKAARADHVHPLSDEVATWNTATDEGNLPELIEDILNSDADDAVSLQSALSEVIGGTDIEEIVDVLASDTAPNPIVSSTGSVGTADEYMRRDAVIQGMPWKSAGTSSSLDSALSEGEVGHTTGTTKNFYGKINSSLVQFPVIALAANYAGLPSASTAVFALTSDDAGLYMSNGTAWYSINAPEYASLPALPSAGMRKVWYEDQEWIGYEGETEWRPTTLLTTESGEP